MSTYKVVVTVPEDEADKLRESHSYEEPIIDVYELADL